MQHANVQCEAVKHASTLCPLPKNMYTYDKIITVLAACGFISYFDNLHDLLILRFCHINIFLFALFASNCCSNKAFRAACPRYTLSMQFVFALLKFSRTKH